jgi:TRAP-type mannitol/chloroaromatic compound transport system permease small subunit
MQESYVWLHGILFMLGAGYTLLDNGHVRVDIFYRPKSDEYKA